MLTLSVTKVEICTNVGHEKKRTCECNDQVTKIGCHGARKQATIEQKMELMSGNLRKPIRVVRGLMLV